MKITTRILLGIAATIGIGAELAAAGNVSGTATINLGMTHRATNSAASEPLPRFAQDTWAGGYTNLQMNQWISKSYVLTTGSFLNVDICGGVTDSFGTVANFKHTRIFAVEAASSNTAALGVFGPAAFGLTAFTATTNDRVLVTPGATFLLYNPQYQAYTNTDGATDVLQITNYGGMAYFDLHIGGSIP